MSDKDINEEDVEEKEEFFDANDYFVGNNSQMNGKKEKSEKREENRSEWFGLKTVWNSVSTALSALKAEEHNKELRQKTKIEEMIISIRDESRREQTRDGQTSAQTKGPDRPLDERAVKIEIISDNETTDEWINRRTEVTVINEEDIQIVSDDIEMGVYDSIKLLINIIAVLILDLFIISGTAHWIYNHLGGLDWYLVDKTYFNFHIFFMCLAICGFGIGQLSHRIFRGWSSGALNFLHSTLTLLTLIFFLIGVYSVFVSLNYMQSIHLYSVHSWLGLLSIVSFALLWISGLIIFVFPRFVYEIQMLLIPIHSFLGRLIFALVCGTAITGISDKLRISDSTIDLGPIASIQSNVRKNINFTRDTDLYWDIPEEAFICNIIAIVILLYALSVSYLSANDTFKRRLTPEEQGIEIKTRIK